MVANGSWDAFLDIKLEFIVYAVSFMVCFNFWNYNNHLFSIVNKVNARVIWIIGVALFLLSLIPYLTVFVSFNPDSFFPSFLYGLDFVLIVFTSLINTKALKDSDPANIALQVALEDNKPLLAMVALVFIGMIIGYFVYPLAVVIACLVSIITMWILT